MCSSPFNRPRPVQPSTWLCLLLPLIMLPRVTFRSLDRFDILMPKRERESESVFLLLSYITCCFIEFLCDVLVLGFTDVPSIACLHWALPMLVWIFWGIRHTEIIIIYFLSHSHSAWPCIFLLFLHVRTWCATEYQIIFIKADNLKSLFLLFMKAHTCCANALEDGWDARFITVCWCCTCWTPRYGCCTWRVMF